VKGKAQQKQNPCSYVNEVRVSSFFLTKKIRNTSWPAVKLHTVENAPHTFFRFTRLNTICHNEQEPTNFTNVRYALLSDVLSKLEKDDSQEKVCSVTNSILSVRAS
jgi:hypothetical protein